MSSESGADQDAATSSIAETETTPQEAPTPSKVERILRKTMGLFYVAGIIWTCLHPMASIITGEMKCRGWYLDEHSIDIKFAESAMGNIPSHLKAPMPATPQGITSFCGSLPQSLESKRTAKNLSCHTHGTLFEMVTVVPLSNAVDPIEEALVFVVPPPPEGDWSTSKFHWSLVRSMQQLANPLETPWLAKSVIVVTPVANGSLEDTVETFLDAYLGSRGKTASSVPPLPPRLSGAILRCLIVLEIDDQSTILAPNTRASRDRDQLGQTDFSILPQGRRGVLPNLDLVFLMGKLFTQTTYLYPRKYPKTKIFPHSFANISRHVEDMLSDEELKLGIHAKRWGKELTDMGLFAYTMAMGPYPPHAVALDRGIDSITVHARFQGKYQLDPSVETVQYFEFLVRALSNLHERLHHSYTLYYLPSYSKFVSHMEYFLPNILILLPMAVRGFGLVLWHDAKLLSLTTIGMTLLTALSTMGMSAVFLTAEVSSTNAGSILVGWYGLLAIIWKSSMDKGKNEALMSSFQVATCFLAVYILAPIAFAHTSLSYPASVLWTPLLAFPNYGRTSSRLIKVFLAVLVFATAPQLLQIHLFSTFTPFVQFVYVPLHTLFFLLTAMTLLS